MLKPPLTTNLITSSGHSPRGLWGTRVLWERLHVLSDKGLVAKGWMAAPSAATRQGLPEGQAGWHAEPMARPGGTRLGSCLLQGPFCPRALLRVSPDTRKEVPYGNSGKAWEDRCGDSSGFLNLSGFSPAAPLLPPPGPRLRLPGRCFSCVPQPAATDTPPPGRRASAGEHPCLRNKPASPPPLCGRMRS